MATSGDGLRAAVVGTGFGVRAHVPALRVAGFDVVALVGRDPERTKQRADASGVPVATTSFEDALTMDLDAVAIATPPATHAPLARQAIAAGCHLLVEKPFTLNTAEARDLLERAEAANIVHLIAHEFRWAPANALGARLLAEGAVEDPELATFVSWLPYMPNPDVPTSDWLWEKAELGGWLGAAGVHTLDQLRTWLGEARRVRAWLSVVSERDKAFADDTFELELTMASGCRVVIQQTAAAWGIVPGITAVAGPKATLWVDRGTVRVADRSGTREVDLPDDLARALPAGSPQAADDDLATLGVELLPFVGLTRHFRELIVGRPVPDAPRGATFADGVAVMQIVDAAIASAAAGGEPVEIEP